MLRDVMSVSSRDRVLVVLRSLMVAHGYAPWSVGNGVDGARLLNLSPRGFSLISPRRSTNARPAVDIEPDVGARHGENGEVMVVGWLVSVVVILVPAHVR